MAAVLIREHLTPRLDLEALSARTGIPAERLGGLADGTEEPYTYEVGELAEALEVDPVHLFRSSPVVAAQRRGEDVGVSFREVLVEFDLHIAVHGDELDQSLPTPFPANSSQGARTSGEAWSTRSEARGFQLGEPDPLLMAVEERMGVPVLYWPVAGAPFGATVRFGNVVGIWINTAGVPGSQQRFTLAHEVGHLALGHVGELRIEPSERLADAEQTGPPGTVTEESHANAFASGVLADHNTLRAWWDGATSPESVAPVAAHIGASYDATLNLLQHHFPRHRREFESARGAVVRRAYARIGLREVYDHFESGRDLGRVPQTLPAPDVLEFRLRRALS